MTAPDRGSEIFVGRGERDEFLSLGFANRHGLVTGATGTGKTVTLQVLAEGLSRAGVAVFAADIKGDLSGIAARGAAKPEFVKRASDLGFAYAPDQYPVVFWDLFGRKAIRSAPPCSRWGRFWCRGCSISTTCRKASSILRFAMPTMIQSCGPLAGRA